MTWAVRDRVNGKRKKELSNEWRKGEASLPQSVNSKG
jgi:hypothetical protein